METADPASAPACIDLAGPQAPLGHAVDRLKARAAKVGRGLADDDIAVIALRRMEADILLDALQQTVKDRPGYDLRPMHHDLMNALGAINNYAELVAEDVASLAPEAQAVRAAVRNIVTSVREAQARTSS